MASPIYEKNLEISPVQTEIQWNTTLIIISFCPQRWCSIWNTYILFWDLARNQPSLSKKWLLTIQSILLLQMLPLTLWVLRIKGLHTLKHTMSFHEEQSWVILHKDFGNFCQAAETERVELSLSNIDFISCKYKCPASLQLSLDKDQEHPQLAYSFNCSCCWIGGL